ncbi:hypothetical protein [Kitasatospora sp. HPMI-4]|uniref:hypothetical protein n=1 Tax=Kitasatospora sp. HPMI-4 TaxID=3448443 RepID=UPI003F1CDF41
METATERTTVLCTAELIEENGRFTLVVRDFVRDTVQRAEVSGGAVDRLPYFLSLLRSKQRAGY